jgi:hypothetical protein
MIRLFPYLFLLLPFSLSAQLRLNFQVPPGGAFEEEAVWAMTMENPTGQVQRVYLQGELRDARQAPAWQGRTEPFNLPPGKTTFPVGAIRPASASWRDDTLRQGNYNLCVVVFTDDNNTQLGQLCAARMFAAPKVFDRRNTAGTAVYYSGTARITGQLGNRQNPFSLTPPSFARLEAQPRLSAFGIPLQGNIFLSTEQQSLLYELNTVNLQLDVHALKNNFVNTLEQRLKEDAGGRLSKRLIGMRDSIYQAQRAKLSPVLDRLSDSALISQLNELRKLERIDEILKQGVFDELKRKWRKYEKMGEEELAQYQDSLCRHDRQASAKFERLKSQYDEYHRLLEVKAELEQHKQQLQKVANAKAKLEELEPLKSQNWRSMLQDEALIRKTGVLSKGEEILSTIDRLGVGVVFPFHSQLTLNGVSLRGMDIAFQPGSFFGQLSTGRIMATAFLNDTFGRSSVLQNLLALRGGWGEVDGNHVYVSMLRGNEKQRSALDQPRSNTVLGLQGQWALFG